VLTTNRAVEVCSPQKVLALSWEVNQCKSLIVGRKAFFILVITRFNKSFMKTAESLARGVLENKHSLAPR
jgi:hypothetical protein